MPSRIAVMICVVNHCEREDRVPLRGVVGIVTGNSVTYTLSDGKKIQKVTDVVTGDGIGSAGGEFSASVIYIPRLS